MKELSIIIPVYNAGKYLARCLDSLVSQTFQGMEIILINDGSTDASAAMCRKYARDDSRIILLSQDNQGVVIARNKGIQVATGRYMLFIDADDRIPHEYCQKLFTCAEQSGADIVFANVCRMKGGAVLETSFYHPGVRTSLPERLALIAELYYPAPWGKIYRADLIKDNGLRFLAEEGYFGFAEDILFALQTSYAARKTAFCDTVYHYHADNVFSQCNDPARQERNNRDRLVIIDKMLSFAVEYGFTREACAPVLQAVENHLRWGGPKTMDAFRQGLESRGYPEYIVNHFKKVVAESYQNEKRGVLAGGKAWAKQLLRRFPALYSVAARIYRR
jgi:glycosyltransferase involved in cell wall biosynthesis